MAYTLNKNIAVSDAGFLFNPVTGESFSVNPMGIGIVNFIREGKNLSEIRDKISAEYEVDSETAERDLMEFINLLNHFQLTENHAR